jgi:hypothetical protein
MPTDCSPDRMEFARVEGRAVEAAFDGGTITSDAGALLLGATDRAIGLVSRFAACFVDHRAADQVEHGVSTLVGQRVLAPALGYEDLVDHDTLRHDPVLAAVTGKLSARRAGCAALSAPLTSRRGIGQRPMAGKSTLNRLEPAPAGAPTRYHKIGHDAALIERLFVDLFLDAHTVPPSEIVLDLDATDDPIHGAQEGRFFHGYYGCYCYLPLHIFCGDHLLAAIGLRPIPRRDVSAADRAAAVEHRRQCRRGHGARTTGRPDPGTLAASRPSCRPRSLRDRIDRAAVDGADHPPCRQRLRARRADGPPIAVRSAAVETEPQGGWAEQHRVDYVLGLARNSRLSTVSTSRRGIGRSPMVGEIATELAAATAEAARTGKPARCFKDFRYQTIDSWSCARRVVGPSRALARARFADRIERPRTLDGRAAGW